MSDGKKFDSFTEELKNDIRFEISRSGHFQIEKISKIALNADTGIWVFRSRNQAVDSNHFARRNQNASLQK